MSIDDKHQYMREAIKKAEENFILGKGGPFGSVVVRNGEIIAIAGNCVTSTNDPTAHAEVVAMMIFFMPNLLCLQTSAY